MSNKNVVIFGGCAFVGLVIALPIYFMSCDAALMPLCPAYKTATGYINAIASYDGGGNSDSCPHNFFLGYGQVQLQDLSTCRLYVIWKSKPTCDADSAVASAASQYTLGQNMTVTIPKAQDVYHPSSCYVAGGYTKQLAIVGIVFLVFTALCVVGFCVNVCAGGGGSRRPNGGDPVTPETSEEARRAHSAAMLGGGSAAEIRRMVEAVAAAAGAEPKKGPHEEGEHFVSVNA